VSDRPAEPVRRRGPVDALIQIAGFAIGIALIVWCARRALEGGGADAIRERVVTAPLWLHAMLLLTTLVSLIANGALFWSLIRPVHPLPFREVQAVNLLASFLNYAPLPLRLGLFARAGYHWRVNRMSPTLIAAWFAAALVSIGVGVGAVAGAMLLAPRIGLSGVAAVTLVFAAIGVMTVVWTARRSLFARWMRGNERMLTDAGAFGGATALRILDLAAWAARMVCAVIILDIPISTTQAAFLGLTAVVASMSPFGRFGFREAAVAWVASNIFEGAVTADDLTATFARLALLESAAEGAVTIPLGSIAAVWCWLRYRRTALTARRESSTQ